jgi:hypothetical protein
MPTAEKLDAFRNLVIGAKTRTIEVKEATSKVYIYVHCLPQSLTTRSSFKMTLSRTESRTKASHQMT